MWWLWRGDGDRGVWATNVCLYIWRDLALKPFLNVSFIDEDEEVTPAAAPDVVVDDDDNDEANLAAIVLLHSSIKS